MKGLKLRITSPLEPFLKREIEKILKLAKELEAGTVLDKETLDFATEAFFQSGKGVYIGVDSNLPSDYLRLYPNYLDIHGRYPYPSHRILLIPYGNALHDEYAKNPEDVQKFLRWHVDHGVDLRYIHRVVAEEIAKKYGLPTTDVGVWTESFAVLFSPSENGIWVKLVRNTDPLFGKVLSYAQEVLRRSERVRELKGIIFSRRLASVWERYVSDRKKFHRFLERILDEELPKRNSLVLDVGAGTGSEVLYLLKRGFNVEANEIDIEFRKILESKLESSGFSNVNVYSLDWRELRSVFKNRKFGALLCVGNSISMVKRDERPSVIRSFYSILADGGVLVVDERNYPAMTEVLQREGVMEKRELLKTLGAEDYMYTDDVPVKLRYAEGKVKFMFFNGRGEFLGDLETYPLARGELYNLLKGAGFKEIKVYADLKPVDAPDYESSVAFYLYVAKK